MKKYINILIGIVTLIFVASCSKNHAINEDNNSGSNSVTLKYDIERIEYSASPCFGMCPQFSIEIDKDRKAIYTAKRFNFSKEWTGTENDLEGVFEGVIDESVYNVIVELLIEMNFPALNERYAVQWTDDQTGNIKVVYDSGKVKEISDYGMRGTPELVEFHKLFLKLRENQNWEEVE